MIFSEVVVKYHKLLLVGKGKKFTLINFSGGRKKLKNGNFFLPPLNKIKLKFHVLAVDLQIFL